MIVPLIQRLLDRPGPATIIVVAALGATAWGVAHVPRSVVLFMLFQASVLLLYFARIPRGLKILLTAIALGIWIVGILIVSNVWKTPTYKVILAWDPEALPADWEAVRQRYFTINWLQFATTWAVFALFLVALISL